MSRERDESEERNDNNHNRRSSRHYEYIVKLRGIPSSSTNDDIKKFLYPCRIINVHLFDNNGDSANECFVALDSDVDVKDALKKSGSFLDKKRIEVFPATNYEYNFHVKNNGKVSWQDPVIRMSGLPFDCTMADVQKFFDDIEIARNGIYITRDMADKALGDGFVAFVNMDNAYKAIDQYNQKRIQHRYIELFPSSYDDAKQRIMDDARLNAKHFVGEEDDEIRKNVNHDNNNNNNDNSTKRYSRSRSRTRSRTRSRSRQRSRSRSTSRDYRQRETKRRYSPPRSRPSPRNNNRRTYNNDRRRSRSRSPIRHSSSRTDGHLVKIRGMPYTVVEEDIRKFFPSTCQPTRIEIVQDRRMKRPNGDGNLYFATLDQVTEAMAYDRKYMGNRYVELYFDSPKYGTLNIRKKKFDDPPRRPSQSPPPKPRNSRYSRSRSESMD